VRSALARRLGLTEQHIQAAIQDPDTAPIDERTRAALRYAEDLVDHRDHVDEAYYEHLKAVFTSEELVELGVFVALCIGFDTLISTLDLSPDSCPI
jgi:alkylhydroperoxidase family enzyme